VAIVWCERKMQQVKARTRGLAVAWSGWESRLANRPGKPDLAARRLNMSVGKPSAVSPAPLLRHIAAATAAPELGQGEDSLSLVHNY
jgi:hypothetical protein